MKFIRFAALIFLFAGTATNAENNPFGFYNLLNNGSFALFTTALQSQGFVEKNYYAEVVLSGSLWGENVLVYPKKNSEYKLLKVSVLFLNDYTEEQVVQEYNRIYSKFIESDKYELKSGSIIPPISFDKAISGILHPFANCTLNGAYFYLKFKNEDRIYNKWLTKLWISPSSDKKYNILLQYENINAKPIRPDF